MSRPHKDVVGGESPLFILSSKNAIVGRPTLNDMMVSSGFCIISSNLPIVNSGEGESLLELESLPGDKPSVAVPCRSPLRRDKTKKTGDRKKEWRMDA